VLVAKAVRRIADFWNLSDEGLGEILGLSRSTASELHAATQAPDRPKPR
jgi:hypothetical protein